MLVRRKDERKAGKEKSVLQGSLVYVMEQMYEQAPLSCLLLWIACLPFPGAKCDHFPWSQPYPSFLP